MTKESNQKASWLSFCFKKDMIVMFFMGLACGFPFALTASTLKAWLSDYNISMREVGYFAFVAIPYSLKFFWSPIIDGVKLPFLSNRMGHRRSWLILIQTGLII